ncbi:MAG TPA: response regulator [Deltaproteobacteria bacterium]|nr:response regulator [Deltaproteobacteria bacterium]HOM28088.1 response regulator [Deltaproteobacteria bacterium]HPP80531.1 response regulator [Deltaproteobacteria bacterium]
MKRILIVEDDRSIQELLKQELNDEGYATSIAGNGREALDLLRSDAKFDLIVLDLRMPAMDGFETMGHILKLKEETPVVIHTAYPSYKNDALAQAADAFVVKSHDLTALKKTIFSLIGK